ncbi:MAG: pseudouridine synthase, partial [Oscillospiraceae bacterium]
RGRKCVSALVEDAPDRVYPVGRLDLNSEGLLLFTNDGAFANMMMHPAYQVPKCYRVTVHAKISDEQMLALSEGVVIEGKRTNPAEVRVVAEEDNRSVMLITITEGRNRQVRKMCEAVNLEVARLKRISVGPLKLGMLKPGTYRELTKDEVDMLFENVGRVARTQKESKGEIRHATPKAPKRW